MRITVVLDDALVEKAIAYTGISQKSQLIREAFKALVEKESARALARLGGSEPQSTVIPRRRSELLRSGAGRRVRQ
jgi:Arc/MetJ family transcription regulator